MRRRALETVFVCAVLFAQPCLADASGRRSIVESDRGEPPNVVLIVADDLAWDDHGFMGNDRVQTPALDSLAETGVLFPNGHLWASLCLPTQRSLLTGVHHSVEIGDVSRWPTLPRVVAASRSRTHRYRTFQAGKLWQASARAWGFGEPAGEVLATLGRHGNRHWGRYGWDPDRCGSLGDRRGACPATAEWDAFLDSVRAEDGERFFALFTPEIPHVPRTPPRRYRDLYSGVPIAGLQIDHYPMITWFDELVWEIVNALDSRDLRRDTVILYLVDNGFGSNVPRDSSYPGVNSGKGTLRELGFRTPVVVNGLGERVGRVYPDLVTLDDVFRTVVELTRARGISPLVGGFSLVPRVSSGEPESPRRDVVTEFDARGGVHGVIVRTPEWRYVRDLRNGVTRVYAIDEDPYEDSDLAAELDPRVLVGLEDRIDRWRSEVGGACRVRVRGAPWHALGACTPGS